MTRKSTQIDPCPAKRWCVGVSRSPTCLHHSLPIQVLDIPVSKREKSRKWGSSCSEKEKEKKTNKQTNKAMVALSQPITLREGTMAYFALSSISWILDPRHSGVCTLASEISELFSDLVVRLVQQHGGILQVFFFLVLVNPVEFASSNARESLACEMDVCSPPPPPTVSFICLLVSSSSVTLPMKSMIFGSIV